ncbi:translation initiation factor IF-2-like [Mustela putorius furo]|uniref:Translation initiation factor IF-2-like n=1 Tax=Mustela putorius furo TaxID=9669 RepID=A0A8U0S7F9_MUSPF|nr:translation initiation factor IF-2-like [Mustela putorius furo]XP_044935981.1 translation initiation factor IF-2-like [Mustela putorius furo]XP_044935982.1 translation initiation factor IF-2-like [Mustela putorius furo]XP_044935983.1 translation initiation factor IF-2-like [Mustela putorius furo]XP_044935984.1 translation initiation factor IF-2-like [Mustela putorius furo]
MAHWLHRTRLPFPALWNAGGIRERQAGRLSTRVEVCLARSKVSEASRLQSPWGRREALGAGREPLVHRLGEARFSPLPLLTPPASHPSPFLTSSCASVAASSVDLAVPVSGGGKTAADHTALESAGKDTALGPRPLSGTPARPADVGPQPRFQSRMITTDTPGSDSRQCGGGRGWAELCRPAGGRASPARLRLLGQTRPPTPRRAPSCRGGEGQGSGPGPHGGSRGWPGCLCSSREGDGASGCSKHTPAFSSRGAGGLQRSRWWATSHAVTRGPGSGGEWLCWRPSAYCQALSFWGCIPFWQPEEWAFLRIIVLKHIQ